MAGRTPLIVPFRAGAHALSPDLPLLEQSLTDGITLLELRGPERPFPAFTGWERAGPTAAVSSDLLSFGAKGLLLVSHAQFPRGADVRVPVLADSAWIQQDGRWVQETPHETLHKSLRRSLDASRVPYRLGAVVSGRSPDAPEGLQVAASDEHTAAFLHEAWRRGVPSATILVNATDPRHYRALWPALCDILGRAS